MLEQLIQVGSFTSDGETVVLAFRSDVDFIEVINLDTAGTTPNPGQARRCLWQRGMVNGDALVTYNTDGAATLREDLATNLAVGGFTLVNDSTQPILGSPNDVSNTTNAAQPVVSTPDTQDLVEGDTVRMSFNATNAVRNLAGIDFTVDTIVPDTSFRIATPLANSPGAFGASTGSWRKVNRDPIFYPRVRNIVDLTNANPCVVSLSATHDFNEGERIRLIIPSQFGTTELDGVYASIIDIDTDLGVNTITLNIDATGTTNFTYPLNGAFPFTFAQVLPVGTDQTVAVANNANELASAWDNTAILGISLAAGPLSPAGEDGDEIVYRMLKAGLLSLE
jgi:hypothetical protein